MPILYFSQQYERLVKDLTSSVDDSLPALFPRYRDLMLFAAMLGKQLGVKRDRLGNGGEVDSNYFASEGFNKDGIVYLMGLLETGSTEVLKDGAKECWTLFESYCNGGMEIISGWLAGLDSVENYPQIFHDRLIAVALDSKKQPVIVIKPKRVLTV